jgi:hypothetical protein
MNYNIKRHELLKILSRQRVGIELEKDGYKIIGVSFDNILKELKCNEYQLRELSACLYDNKEIDYYNVDNVTGNYCTEKGLSSYIDKKYLKIRLSNIIGYIKDATQVFIPLLSLIVAIIALTTKLENSERKYNLEIQKLRQEILRIDTRNKKEINQNIQIDSLKK